MTSAPSSTTSPPDPGALELFTARSGAPSLRVGGRALHSPYDPVREAARFAAEHLDGEPPSTVILLGEGLGHVSRAIRDAFPDARVLPVFFHGPIRTLAGADPGQAWAPGDAVDLAGFLRAALGELAVEGLRVLEWPASAQAFPSAARSAAEAVHRVVRERNGSFATTSAMGHLWFRNAVANFLGFDEVVERLPLRPGAAVLIAAPGPSLEQSAGLVARHRAAFSLWALPSSCPLLADAGLPPDLVVQSDPGWYAFHHVARSRVSAPVAMPLSAARGVWSLGRPAARCLPFPISQPVFYERALLAAAGMRGPEIAPHGTVTATAIDLALAAGAGAVVVAGLDLCTRDVASHARPNAFDDLLHLASGRNRPHAGQWYERTAAQGGRRDQAPGTARTTPALRTYAGWFSDGTGKVAPYRLLPSSVELPGMKPLDAASFSELARHLGSERSGQSVPPRPWSISARALPGRHDRQEAADRLLDGWQRLLAMATPGMHVAGRSPRRRRRA